MKHVVHIVGSILATLTAVAAFATTTNVDKSGYNAAPALAKKYIAARKPAYRAALKAASDGRMFFHLPYDRKVQANIDKLVGIDTAWRTKQCDMLPAPALAAEAMMKAAYRASGGKEGLLAQSCFRSIDEQVGIFCNGVRNKPKVACTEMPADRAHESAPPGFSEHATGYTLDFTICKNTGTTEKPVWTGCSGLNAAAFESTATWTWLRQNAKCFGFELSFPNAGTANGRAVSRQGVDYEPWHWRWVGVRDAAGILGSDAQQARRIFGRARAEFAADPGVDTATTSSTPACPSAG